MQPFVSVIVPVYNTEKYLPRCIESIQRQTYTNMEVILLNDGSTDGSKAICNSYAGKDARIRVVSQPNRGIIAAKKTALASCHGQYVMFVDSDDWIEEEQLEAMLNRMMAEDCSLVCANVIMDREGSTAWKRNRIPAGVYETGRIAGDLFYYKDTWEYGILPYSVAKLYPKRLLEDVLGRIEDSVRYAEDKAIVFGCVFQDIKVCFMEEGYYHYCIRDNSVCQSENPDYLVELTRFYRYVKKLFERHAQKEYLFRQLGHYLAVEARIAIDQKLGLASLENPIYRPSYELDPSVFCDAKKDVILYGAGKVGEDYREKLKESGGIRICGWVDKRFESCRAKGMDVCPVETLKGQRYDYVLVAVKQEPLFGEIKEELLHMGVEEDKIVWGKPLRVTYY